MQITNRRLLGILNVALDFEFFLANPVRLVPVNLGLRNRTITLFDVSIAFQFAPSTLAVSNSRYVSDLADDAKVRHAQALYSLMPPMKPRPSPRAEAGSA
jgi:hypothetical protein